MHLFAENTVNKKTIKGSLVVNLIAKLEMTSTIGEKKHYKITNYKFTILQNRTFLVYYIIYQLFKLIYIHESANF